MLPYSYTSYFQYGFIGKNCFGFFMPSSNINMSISHKLGVTNLDNPYRIGVLHLRKHYIFFLATLFCCSYYGGKIETVKIVFYF